MFWGISSIGFGVLLACLGCPLGFVFAIIGQFCIILSASPTSSTAHPVASDEAPELIEHWERRDLVLRDPNGFTIGLRQTIYHRKLS
jgi:hypothetical protein